MCCRWQTSLLDANNNNNSNVFVFCASGEINNKKHTKAESTHSLIRPFTCVFFNFTNCLLFANDTLTCLFVLCVGLRGITATIVVLEEAAYMEPLVVKRVIIPLMSVQQCKLIGLSSPDTCENYYTRMTKLMDPATNKPLFNVIRIGHTCEECARAGTSETCTHVAQIPLPPWKPPGRRNTVRLMMDNEAAFMREQLGIAMSDSKVIFAPEMVQALRTQPLYRFRMDRSVDLLYMVIDTFGGGDNSEFVITTTAYQDGNFVVRFFGYLVICFLFVDGEKQTRERDTHTRTLLHPPPLSH